MKKVIVNGLKLSLFEQRFKKVGSKDTLFAYLETLLKDTRGRKYFAAICKDGEDAKVMHENPLDEVACAEQIVIDIRQLNMSKADNDRAREVLDECVKEWFESVKQRNLSPTNEGTEEDGAQVKVLALKRFFTDENPSEYIFRIEGKSGRDLASIYSEMKNALPKYSFVMRDLYETLKRLGYDPKSESNFNLGFKNLSQ